jgi:hypothetical protein
MMGRCFAAAFPLVQEMAPIDTDRGLRLNWFRITSGGAGRRAYYRPEPILPPCTGEVVVPAPVLRSVRL